MPAYAKEFVPVAEHGQFIKLIPENAFYRVVWIEPLPRIDIDFGSLGAGGEAERELTELYMPDLSLAQYRFIPVTANVWVKEFWSPRAKRMWVTKGDYASLTSAQDYADTVVESLQTTEFFQWQDKKKYMRVRAEAAVPASVVRFYGFRLLLEEVGAQEKYTTVPTEAMGV